MPTPSDKDPAIERLLSDTFGVDRRASITESKCVSCQQPAVEFEDELSRKEFTISGLCQVCQNKVFRDPEEEYPGPDE